MEVEVKEKEQILSIKPLGKNIDAASSRDFKSKVIDLINQGHDLVILNFSNVEFLDSTGLGSLISILKLLSNQKGNMAICEIQEPVKRVFVLTRLNQVFSLYPNEDEALQFLKQNFTSQNSTPQTL